MLVAAGATPRLDLAESAGLRVDGGAVATGADMRTSAADVLAAGDVAYAHNAAAGRPLRVEHWGEALEHGAVAGAVLAGKERRWSSAPGFWSTIAGRTLKYVAWGDGFASVIWTRGTTAGSPPGIPTATACAWACSATSGMRTTSVAASWSRPGSPPRERAPLLCGGARP